MKKARARQPKRASGAGRFRQFIYHAMRAAGAPGIRVLRTAVYEETARGNWVRRRDLVADLKRGRLIVRKGGKQ